MKLKSSAALFIMLIFFVRAPWLYGMGSAPPRNYVPVRVLVVRDASEVKLRIKGYYKMVNFNTGAVLKEGDGLHDLAVAVKDIGPDGMKVIAGEKARIYLNDRQFRGAIDILKSDTGNLMAVNHIDIEEYLYGVLYHEVSHRWPYEVLKAQAIAARTYAIYQKLVTKNRYYDLAADVYSQVYGGRTSEKRRTTKAVDMTMGEVLIFGGRVFPAYYHATCGGRTQDASMLWNIDLPPLKGRQCGFCEISPHYRWKRELTIDDVQKGIDKEGYGIKVTAVEVTERDKTGRVKEISLKGKKDDIKLSGNKFRLLIGPNILRSTNFDVSQRSRYLTFIGKGWGHGVGMCQWGAYNMARHGWKAEEILQYYYPGAEIVRIE